MGLVGLRMRSVCHCCDCQVLISALVHDSTYDSKFVLVLALLRSMHNELPPLESGEKRDKWA